MKKMFLVFGLLLVSFASSTLVQAQEGYEEVSAIDEIEQEPVEEVPAARSRYQGPGLFHGTRFGLTVDFDSFRNQSFRYSGTSYGLGLNLKKPGKYEFGVGSSYLVGQVRNVEVREMGNPYGLMKLGIWSFSRFEMWLHGQATMARQGAKIAARHDTYRAGLEFQVNPLKYVSSLGVGYRLRTNEEDTSVDIRDIVDAELMVGRKIFQKWTVYGHLLWYRAYGVEKNKMEIARTAEWAGAGPGVKWQTSPQFFISSYVTFPLSQSRSVEETEIAVWDASLPSAGDVTWRTDLGVQF
jgi:hypothetical protein